MCGIVGLIEKKALACGSSTKQEMLATIKHRGPDGTGQWNSSKEEWEIFLGHQRLAIIDIEGGNQPFGSRSKERMVFNGEIFNFLELKKHLQARGVSFETRSDTEVLYEWLRSKESLSQLNGMFAFGFWDPEENYLRLVRDPVGIKPLYYAFLPEGGIAFGSELKVLLAHPAISRELNLDAIPEYFFLDYFPAPHTLFKNIFKLPPGTFLEWKNGKLSGPTPYFKMKSLLVNPEKEWSIPQAKTFIESELTAAVKRQMISDVPVGVFLSGGLDSSLIASLASGLSPHKLKTFSIGFKEKDFDESKYSFEVSKFLKTEHYHAYFDESTLLKDFDSILKTLDEPLADPSYLPTFFLSQLTSQEVKVALGGDGGDELWAGYPTYFAHRLASRLKLLPRPAIESIQYLVSKLKVRPEHQSFEWKLKRFFGRYDSRTIHRHFHWMSATEGKVLRDIFKRNVPLRFFDSIEKELSGINSYDLYLALDFTNYLPGSVLTKVDRASMANGLEVRPPFLDQKFIAASFQIPFSFKYRGKENKWLLKKVAEGKIPENILKRKKKGFGIPLARWLLGPLKSEVIALLEERSFLESIGMNPEAVRALWTKFETFHYDASKTFWSLLVLKKVLETYSK